MATAQARARTGNLTLLLVVVAFFELLLNRLANRLFLPQSTPGDVGARALLLADSGALLFHLTGVLGLLVLFAALVGLLRRRELFPRGMRFTVGIIGLVFWMLGACAVFFGQIPARFHLHLGLSFAFLSGLIVVAALAAPTQRRVKLGVTLFALPTVLHIAAVVSERTGWLTAPGGALLLSRAGELVLLAAALAAPVLLPPRPARERPWRRPLVAAGTLTGALLVGWLSRHDLLQATLLYGLRVELPHVDSALGVAYLLAFTCWVYATVQLLVDKGGMRLSGYGLLLLALGGYQASSPLELSLALLGLLALTVGELRAAPYGDPRRPRVGGAEWRLYIGRLATAAGDGTDPDGTAPDAVVVEEGELEVSRITTHRRGLPVNMRLLRRWGTLVELEASVGLAPHGGPDASLERHRSWLARAPEQRVRLPRSKTGDVVFDKKFRVHGAAPLGDRGLRAQVARHLGDGILSLWRGAAARYHLALPAADVEAPPVFAGVIEGDAPVTTLVAILDLLADAVEASAAEP
jgi:hypothetical protein